MSLPELNVKHYVLMDKLKAQRAGSIESSIGAGKSTDLFQHHIAQIWLYLAGSSGSSP